VRKELLYAPMILLLLCSCGATNEQTTDIQARYASIESAVFEADVCSHLEAEDRSYTLTCQYHADGASETTVMQPAELAGLTAVLEGEELKLTYDGSCLSAGEDNDISPADCLPRLLRAIAQGYVKEQGSEKMEDVDCRYALFDTTGRDGGKVEYAVWLAKDDGRPYYWEISCSGKVILSGTCRSFTATEQQTEEQTSK
jgi:outer membrane lipoprotein-sorting protein